MSTDKAGVKMSWREVAAAALTILGLVTALSVWIILPHRVMAVETDVSGIKNTMTANAERLQKMEVDVSKTQAVLIEQNKRMQEDITEIKNALRKSME